MKQSYLIIQLYSNGDCLYATALARQLKFNNPNCSITWAVSPFCAAILFNNPYIDNIWQIEYINDKNLATFKENKSRLWYEAKQKGFDKIYFTQIIDDNFSFYNGIIRFSIFAAFGQEVQVPLTPVLELTEKEKENVLHFNEVNGINKNSYIILFESAPLSGQIAMDNNKAIALAKQLTLADPSIKVILSSQNEMQDPAKGLVDGSVLSLRETAYLTHFCDLLIGCSSGITWISTSSAAKTIPSIQLLDRNAYYFNSPTLDHLEYNLNTSRWLELLDFDNDLVTECVQSIRSAGFSVTKDKFGQHPYNTFRIYRGITHQFIKERKFLLLAKFIGRNLKKYGFNRYIIKNVILGIVLFPLQILVDYYQKKKRGN